MSTKRQLPRRELPLLGTLLDKLPYTRLPTRGVVLRRLMFAVETCPGSSASLQSLANEVKDEMIDVWTYAGYGDILIDPSHIVKSILQLRKEHKDINKIPKERHNTPGYKSKEAAFVSSLDNLLDITKPTLRNTNLITPEDRDFLLHHWDKTISSVKDRGAMKTVEQKVRREEKYEKFAEKQRCLQPTSSLDVSTDFSSQDEGNSSLEYTPSQGSY